MERTVTVKGTGKLKLSPDTIEISMSLDSGAVDYEKALSQGAKELAELQKAIEPLGFEAKDLKTLYYSVDAQYEYENDRRGNSKRVFKGYVCRQNLTLRFPFDTALMSKLLSALARTKAEPELNVQFTVKDRDAVKDELLTQAAENARHKAAVLCAASGAKLGQVLSIDYNWGEINFYSNTTYARGMMKCDAVEECAMAITPDDIEISDSAAFVFALE